MEEKYLIRHFLTFLIVYFVLSQNYPVWIHKLWTSYRKLMIIYLPKSNHEYVVRHENIFDIIMISKIINSRSFHIKHLVIFKWYFSSVKIINFDRLSTTYLILFKWTLGFVCVYRKLDSLINSVFTIYHGAVSSMIRLCLLLTLFFIFSFLILFYDFCLLCQLNLLSKCKTCEQVKLPFVIFLYTHFFIKLNYMYTLFFCLFKKKSYINLQAKVSHFSFHFKIILWNHKLNLDQILRFCTW